MSRSEVHSLIETVEREAELHPVELENIRHIENDDIDGITIRVLETDGETEADQVGFQVTKPNTQMGRQAFTERLESGLRSLTDHVRDNDDTEDNADSERQNSEDDTTDSEQDSQSVSESRDFSDETESDGSNETIPTRSREVGSFSITTELDQDSLGKLSAELEDTFDELTDELPDEEKIADLEDNMDEIDDRLSVLEDKLAMLGSFDSGG
jgi:hypothetical protein